MLLAIGETDCEAIGASYLAQPANTVSSFAYVLVGAWLVGTALVDGRRGSWTRVVYGALVAAVGLGSIAFHGPMPGWARWLHDLSIVAVLLFVVAYDLWLLRPQAWRGAIVGSTTLLVVFGIQLAAVPDSSVAVTAAVVIAAVLLEVAVIRRGLRFTGAAAETGQKVGYWSAGAVLALALAVNVLGRTGAPLCDPNSLAQGHAIWHVLTAAVFGLWGWAALMAPSPALEPVPSERTP